MKVEKISELTTNRLSIYLRCLNELSAKGVNTISSDGLAKRFHLNSAQIRKDLAYFGEFGVRGVGYYVDDLRDQLTKILGLNNEHRVGIIGAGRLGMALSDYHGFTQSNFSVLALFDADRSKIGLMADNVMIYDIDELDKVVAEHEIDVIIIAVPAEYAQDVLEKVTKTGIKAVLNFAPTPLKIDENIKLKSVDLTISLESLSYFLAQPPTVLNENLKPNSNGKRIKPQKVLSKKQGK